MRFDYIISMGKIGHLTIVKCKSCKICDANVNQIIRQNELVFNNYKWDQRGLRLNFITFFHYFGTENVLFLAFLIEYLKKMPKNMIQEYKKNVLVFS